MKADEHVVTFVASGAFGADTSRFFVDQPSRAGGPSETSLAKRDDGTCLFHVDRRCAIQVKGGAGALPIGCRHYPRVLRVEPDVVSLSLSHYCPTAAALLVTGEPISIVTADPPLALDDPIEGLDAREALPPLLRPELLMDHDAYSAWEGHAVQCLASGARDGLLRLAAATDALRTWTPATTPLEQAVAHAFEVRSARAPAWLPRGESLARSLNRGLVTWDPLPDLDAAWTRATTGAAERVLSNYLAARVFGNWVAYQGRGLRTIVAWLQACYDIARTLALRTATGRALTVADVIEGIRQTDYVMLHTVDTQQFANAARPLED